MTVYSNINDIKAMSPFTLDENSRPTLTDTILIQGHAYRMINGYLGEEKTANDDLKVIETDLVIAQILAIHSGRAMPLRLTQEHKIILDDYMDEVELVSSEEIYYGYD